MVRKAVFGNDLAAIHHVGSTSVPGLAAKPIIDFLVEIKDVFQVDRLNAKMIALGYEPKGEYGIPGLGRTRRRAGGAGARPRLDGR